MKIDDEFIREFTPWMLRVLTFVALFVSAL